MRPLGEDAATENEDAGRAHRALSTYRPRNARLVDAWSFVHFAVCAGLALVCGPFIAFLVALVWEPVEVLLLSPWLARFGIDFGHEDLRNSMSDIAFNGLGALAGLLVIRWLGWVPPLAPF